MSPRSQIKKMLLLTSLVVLLIGVSEVAYSIYLPPRLIQPMLDLSQFSLNYSPRISIVLFYYATKIMGTQKQTRYHNRNFDFPRVLIPPPDPALLKEFDSILKSFDFKMASNFETDYWAKTYFQLGLVSYRHRQLDLASFFWQTAALLAPEWSYFHIELANLYLTQNEIEKARSSLEFCVEFQYPQDHCRQFLRDHLEPNQPLPIGVWERRINSQLPK